ncbi:relaxase/mobilization nuclease domain-containing protein [Lentilactobacillus hilgardii]|uniref:relaxase/mobilization nuclease domain-containing protein n=1 Tax=Lentilactobacillus hilgardii TaxID=1588 RepID=UPI0021C3D52C|nr:relaxase/mobilization nuclease domain-containing protein [Lentilactobacillus hilgardii]MCP9334169.1 relaxase/mobilization nuclease domain-containing protein [Lentilactobacillus hilgardii]MCP9350787.1 relaxase/mobilization nuclease domain-containing protein [Lentilactobacillus hilgardii]MCP9353674.1 relaxase/mobilization nuclease domain-containing protein [Lentilactobacillus hilgardii]
MATTHIKRSTSASRLVNYAEKRAVKKDGLNLDIQYAKSEFKQVRDIYGNPGKTQAYASRIAFSPLEFNPQALHDQATVLAVAKEVYAKAYPNQQVALYEHADTDSLHVHAVIGAINLETGQKMHGNWHQYRDHLVHITDQVCQEHGLMVTQPDPNRHEKRSMAEIKLRAKQQPTWKDQIRQAVDHTMQNPLIRDFQAFQADLKQQAVKVWERGKNLTYQLLGTNYKSRGTKLGIDYEKETIFNELASRQTQSRTNQQPERATKATVDSAQSDPGRTPKLPGHPDSTASHSQNVSRSTTSADRTDRPTSQPTVSDNLKQLRQQQRQLTSPIKTDLTKRLRNVSKADQPDQSGKSDRPQTDPSRTDQKHPDRQSAQQPSEPNHSSNDGPNR